MCVFLPDARDGLWWLTDKIACDPDFLLKHLPRSDVEVGDFRLPKFKVSFGMKMNNILWDMGLKVAFERGKANLSDMAEDGAALTLQEVIHQAVIEVNEEGTEAAAATAMIFNVFCSRDPVDFVADHPFAFFLIEEVSHVILFAGHVVDPTIK